MKSIVGFYFKTPSDSPIMIMVLDLVYFGLKIPKILFRTQLLLSHLSVSALHGHHTDFIHVMNPMEENLNLK